MDVTVNLQDPQGLSPIDPEQWEPWLRLWFEALGGSLPLASAYELSLGFTDDREIHQYNAQYRGVDRPTDVLAFAALEQGFIPPLPPGEPLDLGDVIISVETAQRQAIAQGHSLSQELIWLTSHGVLHLLGWDHPDEEQLTAMLAQQTALIALIAP
ncbi:rRNA maturation RNase YbeY [Spirulina sp. CCNP1310]|uniref:rRNA maturation RNase YbeY n=1 Tax=Spirulina sp. CCNP1310 TaxID=3110249 RepID=UPI002B1F792A|nr:rRNA maturation RNase YbeY [Spirulina sp. CCNP1310]MEA5418673.1 rRNA maturation RNase YbeY [Spirulina sp. CCNP1310]